MDSILKYLANQNDNLIKNNFTFRYNSNNNKVAVIVEPRKHPWLQMIVNNIMSNLGDQWNLHIYSHYPDYIQSLFPNCTYRIVQIDYDNLTPTKYNSLFRNLDFWNCINEEHILIFQTDSIIMNNRIIDNTLLKYPFVGGIYHYYMESSFRDSDYYVPGGGFVHLRQNNNLIQLHNSPSRHFSINGGFSLRSKKAMIDCIKKVSINTIINHRKKYGMDTSYFEFITGHNQSIGEDVFFQNALDILGYELPDIDQCKDFCENLSYYNFNPSSTGLHNIKPLFVNRFKEEIETKFDTLTN